MPTVEIELLGRFSVAVDGTPVPRDAWRSRRAADVVKLLALAPAHRMHRIEVMEAIWPESDPELSGANLRKTTAAGAAARVGELERARAFLAEAERIAGMWQGGLWTGAVWEARGILRQAEGDDEQARAMFREAAEAFGRAGNHFDAARCREAADGLRDESGLLGARRRRAGAV